jgi:hypothetical protein
MEFSKQHVIDILRRAGFAEAADEALRALPDPVELEALAQWAQQYGITHDELISRMGGSP